LASTTKTSLPPATRCVPERRNVSKIDFTRRTLLVDAQVGQHGGFKRTKTGRERTVDLSRYLAKILSERANPTRLKETRVVSITGEPHGVEAPSPREGPWLLYPNLGASPSRKDAFRIYKNALRAMRRCLEAAALPTHYGLHSLRHTYGSGLVSAGVSLAYTKEQMGHRSIQQTVDTYGCWLKPTAPGAVDTLAATFAEGCGHSLDTSGVSEATAGA
jgi:integrase